MKKIGLSGGTGPESTLVYYKELNKRINKIAGGIIFPEIVIDSLNLDKALGLVGKKQFSELTDYISQSLENLEKSGADIISLTSATMHVVYDELKKKVHVPFISIPEVSAEYAVNKGFKKVGLLGTIFTMENDFLSKAFVNNGIQVYIPSDSDRSEVHKIIANELEHGIVKEESQKKLISTIEKMKNENGIEAIILGCTELPLALNSSNSPVECIDIMDVHIQKLVEIANGN